MKLFGPQGSLSDGLSNALIAPFVTGPDVRMPPARPGNRLSSRDDYAVHEHFTRACSQGYAGAEWKEPMAALSPTVVY
jgi:hypothetical protein